MTASGPGTCAMIFRGVGFSVEQAGRRAGGALKQAGGQMGGQANA